MPNSLKIVYIIFIEDVFLFESFLEAHSIYANNERKSYESMCPETLPYMYYFLFMTEFL